MGLMNAICSRVRCWVVAMSDVTPEERQLAMETNAAFQRLRAGCGYYHGHGICAHPATECFPFCRVNVCPLLGDEDE
jgi:hypothetical protein